MHWAGGRAAQACEGGAAARMRWEPVDFEACGCSETGVGTDKRRSGRANRLSSCSKRSPGVFCVAARWEMVLNLQEGSDCWWDGWMAVSNPVCFGGGDVCRWKTKGVLVGAMRRREGCRRFTME